jgi:hypothetical protein
MSNIDTDGLVEAYINIRNTREQILREYEAKDKALKEDMAQIEAALLDLCNTINVDTLKTKHGLAMRGLKERFTCNDWGNFYKFILDHGAVEVLERRIHQGNFKEFMKNREEDGLPPGVDVMREYAITVRKPSNK